MFTYLPCFALLILGPQTDLAQITPGACVEIRGFLYETPEHEWLLAGMPNLKSCCLGKCSNNGGQVLLEGVFDAAYTNRAVTVKGVWEGGARPRLCGASLSLEKP